MAYNNDTIRRLESAYMDEARGATPLAKNLLATGIGMLKFSIGMAIAVGTAGAINRGIGKTLVEGIKRGGFIARAVKVGPEWSKRTLSALRKGASKLTTTTSAARTAERSGMLGEAIGSAKKITNKPPPTLTKIISKMDWFSNSAVGRRINYMNRVEKKTLHSMRKLGEARKNQFFSPGKPLLNKSGQARMVKGLDGNKRALDALDAAKARAWRLTKRTATAAPFEYAISRIGQKDKDDHNPSKWYHPSEIGSYLTSTFVGDVFMSSVSPLAKKMVSKTIGPATGNAFRAIRRSSNADIVGKSLNFLQKVSDKMDIHSRAFSNSMQELRNETSGVKGLFTDFHHRLDTAKDIFGHQYSAHTKKLQQQLDINRMKGNYGKIGLFQSLSPATLGSMPPNILNQIRRTISKDLNKPHNEKVTGFLNKYANAGDTSIQSLSKNIYIPGSGKLDGGISDRKTLYAGSGFYSYGGKNYDLHSLVPANFLRMGIRTLGSSFSVLGNNIGNLFQLGTIPDMFDPMNAVTRITSGSQINLGFSTRVRGADDLAGIGKAFRRAALSDVPKGKGEIISKTDPRSMWEVESEEVGQFLANHSAAAAARQYKLNHPNDNTINEFKLWGRQTKEMAYNLERGKYVVADEQTAFNINGRLFLYSKDRNIEGYEKFSLLEMGINPKTGEPLRYSALQSNALKAAHDSFMGRTREDNLYNSEQRPDEYGYGGAIPDRNLMGSGGRVFHRIMRKWDLGGKKKKTIFGRIAGFFSDMVNPHERRVLFSKEIIQGAGLPRIIKSGNKEAVEAYGGRAANMIDDVRRGLFYDIYGQSEESLDVTKRWLVQNGIDIAQNIHTTNGVGIAADEISEAIIRMRRNLSLIHI